MTTIPIIPAPLYVLVAVGVSDQGVVGVYSSEPAAREAAEAIWPQTDGYHGFEVREYVLDQTREHAFPYTCGSYSPAPPKGPVQVDREERD